MKEEGRCGERVLPGGGPVDQRRPLAEPLQPGAPARAVERWCRDQSCAIHVGNLRLSQT